jgi:hypothetical protein
LPQLEVSSERQAIHHDYVCQRGAIPMNIKEVMSASAVPPKVETEEYTIHGDVTPDTDPNYIRIYRNPSDKRSYWLLRTADIVGDLTKWTPEEKVHAGLFGENMYIFSVRHGTVFQSVEISIEKIGETIAGDDLVFGNPINAIGECRSSSGCGSKRCCTESSRGCVCNNCCIA